MKANELRIGNWVNVAIEQGLLNEKGVTTIISISSDHVNHWQRQGVFGSIDVNNLNPISLTPEILERAGFRYSEYEEYCNWERGMFCFHSDELKQCIHGRMLVTTVHQLQNLYFALTGEELPIKL